MPSIAKTKLTTAADVTWSGGELFNGYILAVLALPSFGGTDYTKAYLRGYQHVQIPPRVKIPILDGVVQDKVELLQNSQIVPATTRWCLFWFDETSRQIASGPSLQNFDEATETVTPPTLTVPTVASTCPAVVVSTSDLPTTLSLYPIVEVPSGTKNGVNTDFTMSNTPVSILGVLLNGSYLLSGTDYTISGTTISFTTAPLSTDTIQVIYWV